MAYNGRRISIAIAPTSPMTDIRAVSRRATPLAKADGSAAMGGPVRSGGAGAVSTLVTTIDFLGRGLPALTRRRSGGSRHRSDFLLRRNGSGYWSAEAM